MWNFVVSYDLNLSVYLIEVKVRKPGSADCTTGRPPFTFTDCTKGACWGFELESITHTGIPACDVIP